MSDISSYDNDAFRNGLLKSWGAARWTLAAGWAVKVYSEPSSVETYAIHQKEGKKHILHKTLMWSVLQNKSMNNTYIIKKTLKKHSILCF